MSNSMPLEKIFIIMAIILGLGSAVDLAYSIISLDFAFAELLRCLLNIIIAVFLYRYFKKKQQAKISLTTKNEQSIIN
ncbi:hypothetical protein FGD67_18860 [Colwellia sp. M166]|uniref:hypothetical protein n=1 Tax=Colwellia sp. M166 TaxID=2583805 RepID=UPI00211E93F8|nr:hypothetical protein [Colwellia sp. M166]UUO25040.1 hypothetical protein FGD67_18860 [Colwellia sp. M166]